MRPEFASVFSKIGRAEEHLKAFLDEWTVWDATKPSTVRKVFSMDGRTHKVFVDINNQPPFIRWSLIAGDCVHNLRSALDHLVYALAIRDTGINPPANEKKLQFPIGDTAADFEDKKKRYALNQLSPKSIAFLESVQPYNRANLNNASLLLALNDFDIVDKHRALRVAYGLVGEGEIKFRPEQAIPMIEWKLNRPVGQSAEVARFTIEPPKKDLDYEIRLVLRIIIQHLRAPNGSDITPLGPMMHVLIDEVNRIVGLADQI